VFALIPFEIHIVHSQDENWCCYSFGNFTFEMNKLRNNDGRGKGRPLTFSFLLINVIHDTRGLKDEDFYNYGKQCLTFVRLKGW